MVLVGPLQRNETLRSGHWFPRSGCNIDDVKRALEEGLDPNSQWKELDLVDPLPTSGCVRYGYSSTGDIWSNSNTPLHKSLQNKHYDAAALLLDNGARINLRNAIGRTPLHEAVHRVDYECVQFLLEKKADIDAISEARTVEAQQQPNRYGTAGISPLHEAIRDWDHRMAKLLVDAGANLGHASPTGWTVLDLALLERAEPIIHLLIQHKAQLSERNHPIETIAPLRLQTMANKLLHIQGVMPPLSEKEAYFHIIERAEFLESWNAAVSTKSKLACQNLLDTFIDLLSKTAGKPNPEDVPGAPLCARCTCYLKQLSPMETNVFELHPDRESLELSVRDGCRLCAIFEDALVNKTAEWAEYRRRTAAGHKESSQVVLHAVCSPEWLDFTIAICCGKECETVEVCSLSDSFLIDHREYPDDPDLGTGSRRAFASARAWFENCSLNHESCNKISDHSPALPKRILDVGNGITEPSLLHSNGMCAPYLALSYCWGHSNNVKTTTGTVLDHMKVIPLSLFPATLRDAIVATRQLGFRFLWIDSICIVQDDKDDWNREAAQMQSIYANAAITLSALASEDAMGGLFRPRQKCITTPVQLSLRIPRKIHGHFTNKAYDFVLPVQGEKDFFKPGPVNSRAWTLQEQLLSTRVLHFGHGIIYWDCLSYHGSEADPEGSTTPYRSGRTNFMEARKQKLVVQGHQARSSTSRMQRKEPSKSQGSSADEAGSETESTNFFEKSDFSRKTDEERQKGPSESNGGKWHNVFNDKKDPRTIAYLEWQKLIPEYTSRRLTNQTDKVPAFLGVSKVIARTIQDEFIAGIWEGPFFFPSLLWATDDKAASSRNEHYPSWTWASVNGKINYPITYSRISWEPSDVKLNIHPSGPSQNSVTGSISLKSTVKKFPRHYDLFPYKEFSGIRTRVEAGSGRDFFSRLFGWQERIVVEGFQDPESLSPKAKSCGDWKCGGDDISCVVLARIDKELPPQWGYPEWPTGRPKSIVCLCLAPVHDGKAIFGRQQNVFRRVGLCHFWDGPTFWKGAKRDQWVTII